MIGGLTALCTAFFACHGLLSGKGLGYNSYIIVRWLLIIGVVIGCIILIDTETAKPHFYLQESEDLSGKEYWFGNSTRAEREYVADPLVAYDAIKRDMGYGYAIGPKPSDPADWTPTGAAAVDAERRPRSGLHVYCRGRFHLRHRLRLHGRNRNMLGIIKLEFD